MDVLTDLLQRSHARGAAFSRTRIHGQWAIRFPVNGTLAVHAIVEGDLVAWADDPHAPTRLMSGDVVLLRASPHHLASAAGLPVRPFQEVIGDGEPLAGTRVTRVGIPSDGPAAEFVCGAYLFDGDLSASLIDALPPLVRLRPAAGSPLRATLDLLVAEMTGDGPGQQALLDRLLDVVLVQALRTWFAEAESLPGWLRAVDDPGLGAALRAVHAEPARAWTVATLAAEARMSRSTFAQRFTEVVGVPPLQYLTAWRIALAKERLRDSGDGLAAVAASVGYGSEFSFASAFKRQTGRSPGRWRAERAG